MFVVLSQRIDTESTYSDELFSTYHYPAKYRNQLHEGDIFVYYQGNQHDKSQRYYFGAGMVGGINSSDGENYYAKLIDGQRFEKTVPIYLPDGGYIEQLGYDSVRKSINPPWQSSIRPLSQQAFNYIIEKSGLANKLLCCCPLEEKKELLKKAVRAFFLEKKDDAIIEINKLSAEIAVKLGITE